MRNNVKSATEHVSVRNRENAVAYAEAIASQVFDIIVSGGKNPNRIAMLLNKHGVATPAGGKWHRATVVRLLERLGPGFFENARSVGKAKSMGRISDLLDKIGGCR